MKTTLKTTKEHTELLIQLAKACEDDWNPVVTVKELYDLCHDADRARELEGKIEEYKSIMMAAAVEISEHWEAHCDMDGYGPSSLVRRLESGDTGGGYGYNAKTVIDLTNEVDSKNAEITDLRAKLDEAERREGPLKELVSALKEKPNG